VSWPKDSADETYDDKEAGARLSAELPFWFVDDGHICRKYSTGGWKATLMVTNAIGHLAEAAFHHPDLSVSYALVVVKLKTHSAGAITEKDFALAAGIEAFIQWQPGAEEGPLEGPPEDPRYAYIKYDSPSG
jgi:4a-hydroxytetrahydrobiopterin dehydratase